MDNCTDIINRAWQRVCESESESKFESDAVTPRRSEYIGAKSHSANDTLREFIAAEHNFAAFFESMLRRSRSQQSASVFRQIISDGRAHCKKLQTEYFLLTCDTYVPTTEKICVKSPMCAIREGYMRKIKSADSYRLAAKESNHTSFAAMLEQFARDEEHHAAALKNLLEYIMN